MAKERDFFQDKLGARVDMMEGMPGYAVVHAGHDSMIVLYERHHQPPCEATAATFFVEDLDRAMSELRAKGVQFEEYDRPALKTQGGVAMQGDSRAAWFTDPCGNILALTELGTAARRQMQSLMAAGGRP